MEIDNDIRLSLMEAAKKEINSNKSKLTQAKIGEKFGFNQARTSDLLNYKYTEFSIVSLVKILNQLNMSIIFNRTMIDSDFELFLKEKFIEIILNEYNHLKTKDVFQGDIAKFLKIHQSQLSDITKSKYEHLSVKLLYKIVQKLGLTVEYGLSKGVIQFKLIRKQDRQVLHSRFKNFIKNSDRSIKSCSLTA